MSNLYSKALVGLLLLFLAMAALLFVPPWTFDYWQAWIFLAVYFAASIAISLYLIKGDPQLLARRTSGGPAAEKRPAQKIIMSLTSLGFIGLLVVPALGYLTAATAPAQVPTLFLGVIPVPHLVGTDPAWFAVLRQMHRALAILLVALATAHALAALANHLRGHRGLVAMWRG